MVSSWFGGLWPGILAGLISTLALDYYFVPPIYSFVVSSEYVPNLIVFVSSSLFISWLNGEEKRANADLAQENRDRRKAEEALRAREQQLQDIVDYTTAVIFVKDLELRYLLVNCEFERLHQVRRDQIRGKTDFDILPHDVAETVRANDRQVIESGEPIQIEEAVPSLEGGRVYVFGETPAARSYRQAIRGLWHCNGYHRV